MNTPNTTQGELELEPLVKHFVSVAIHGSFTAAAEATFVSQPSLSAAVRRLEERLGVQLLHRDRRGVEPTRAGRALLSRARLAQALLQAAVDEIASTLDEPQGRYTIGMHESLGAYFLPGFLTSFYSRFPKVELALKNANSREVEVVVSRREVDIGLVVNPAGDLGCEELELFHDEVAFVVLSKLAEGNDPRALLTRSSLLVVPQILQTRHLLNELASMSIKPARHLECSSMALVKSLVLDGAGVGVLPWRVAVHGLPPGHLTRLKLPAYRDRIAMVWRKDAPETAALAALKEALRTHGESLRQSV